LSFDRVQPLVEGHDRRLGRGRVIGEARSVRRAPFREDLSLHLLDLPF